MKMTQTISTRRRSGAIATVGLGALVLGLSGCGGSGSSSPTSAALTPISLSAESMGTASDTNLAAAGTQATVTDSIEGAALNTGAVSDVSTSDSLLTSTSAYLSSASAETKAAKTRSTVTADGVMATITVTPVSLTSAKFTITLNGTPNGTSIVYTNFVFATGVATRGTNGTESGTHYVVTYNRYNASATTSLATSDNWVYNDGSGIGSFSYTTTGSTAAYTKQTTNDWTWSLYQGGNAATGTLRGKVSVNADHSGSANYYCTSDGQIRSMASWTGTGNGQFCRYMTACTPKGDHPCVAYPAGS